MTEVQMKNFLEGHFYASKKIKALEAERKQLRLSAQGGSIGYEGISSATRQNSTERNLVSLADEEKKIDDEIARLKESQRKVRRTIDLLHDDDLEAVLIFRYIIHNTEEQTAEKLNYAPRTVQEKIKKAIKKLCAKMCENV